MPLRSRPRVLAVGLDSVDRRLALRLADEGRLPHLADLLRRGRAGVVRSPPGLGDDAVWASFSSGLPPGRHDRFFWQRLRPGRYGGTPHGAGGPAPPPFWDALARAGRRVAVIDVPKSPLSHRDGCLQLCDWLVHGRDGPTRSHPPEWAAEVLARFGDDRIDRPGTDDFLCREHALPVDLHDEFLRRVRAGLDAKRRAVVEILEGRDWDLFLVVFKEGHCVGHEFWDRVGTADDPVTNTYQALDEALGELLAKSDDDTRVLVFSGLGMAENHTAEHLLDRALLRLEPHLPRAVAEVWPRLAAAEDRLRRRWLPRARASVARSLRTAYQVPHNELSGAIRVNLRGREPSGRVWPGAELEAWYRRMERSLSALVDPDSGRPVVARVIRVDDTYPGSRRDALPDLLVEWRRDGPIRGLASAEIGAVRADDPGFRAGNHVADGFFVAAGPGIEPGDGVEAVSIADLGPVLSRWLGVEPGGSEGPRSRLGSLAGVGILQG